MLRKSITYLNPFDDSEVTEDCYFHLNVADLLELETQTEGGLQKRLERLTVSQDQNEILTIFKFVIEKSYGHRSEDGKRFVRSPEISAEFINSEAYSALLLDMMKHPDQAANFVNQILPKNLDAELDKVRAAQAAASGEIPGGAMGKARTPAEAAALQARSSGELGQPQSPAVQVADPEVEENVFDANNPKILTEAEINDMDAAELKAGIAEGRYKLQ